MAVLLQNTFEGGTDGVTISTGNSGGASGNAFDQVDINGDTRLEFDTDRRVTGNVSALFDHSAATANRTSRLTWSTSLANQSLIFVRTYWYVQAFDPQVDNRIIRALNDAAANAWDLQIQSTGVLRIRSANFSSVAQFTQTIGTGYWFRVELSINSTTGAYEVRGYNLAGGGDPHSTTPTQTLSGTNANFNVPCGQLEFGMGTGNDQGVINLDGIVVDNSTFPGPTSNPSGAVAAYKPGVTYPNEGSASERYTGPARYPNRGSGRWGSVLHLATGAWRAGDVSSNGLNLTDLTGNGRPMRFGGNGSTATTNDPTALRFNGTRYLYLPGATGNYASVPSAGLNVTGDLDVSVDVALDDWTPTGDARVASKYTAGGDQRGWILQVNASGTLTLFWSATGVGVLTAQSTAVNTLTDGTRHTIRATLDVDNGAGGYVVRFYVDGAQLGAAVTGGTTTSVFASSAQLIVGASDAGGGVPAAGKFYGAVIKDGIDGTTVLDVDFSSHRQFPGAGGSVTGTAGTGQTVTINRAATGRKSVMVDRPVLLLGTDDYLSAAHNAAFDLGFTNDLTVMAVVRQWGTPFTFSRFLDKQDGTANTKGWRMLNESTNRRPYLYVGDGTVATSTSSALVTYDDGRLSTIAGVLNRTTDTARNYTSKDRFSTAVTDITTVGSENALDLHFGRNSGGPSNYLDAEVYGFAVLVGRALTEDQLKATAQDLIAGRSR